MWEGAKGKMVTFPLKQWRRADIYLKCLCSNVYNMGKKELDVKKKLQSIVNI